MFKIENKIDSYNLILTLGLNKLPEILLPEFDEKKIVSFMQKYPAETYAIRDRNKSGSKKFRPLVKPDKVLGYCAKLKNFSINVSDMYKYQVLTGEVRVSVWGEISLAVSSNPTLNARDGAQNADYNFTSTIFDHRLKRILGMNDVINYLFEHELFDVVVEFASYDRPVGTKNEKVVVFELRTSY